MAAHAEVFLGCVGIMTVCSTSSPQCHHLAVVRRQTVLIGRLMLLSPSVLHLLVVPNVRSTQSRAPEGKKSRTDMKLAQRVVVADIIVLLDAHR